jgi:hypothetical protein
LFLLLLSLATSASNLPERLSIVPNREPTDNEMINRSGYWLCGINLHTELKPRANEANPMAVNKAPCHSGRIRFFSLAPMMLPIIIQHVFGIVPIMHR